MKWETQNQYKEINEPKSGVFEEISKIDKTLQKREMEERHKLPITIKEEMT